MDGDRIWKPKKCPGIRKSRCLEVPCERLRTAAGITYKPTRIPPFVMARFSKAESFRNDLSTLYLSPFDVSISVFQSRCAKAGKRLGNGLRNKPSDCPFYPVLTRCIRFFIAVCGLLCEKRINVHFLVQNTLFFFKL